MRILLNDTPLALGDALTDEARAAAGLRPRSAWRRLVQGLGLPGRRFEALDCTLALFDGEFRIYPCRDGYLDLDRQWRTAVTVVLDRGRVAQIEAKVIEGRYAAPEFVDRFAAACDARWGACQAVDRHTRHWKNGVASFHSRLYPDGRNAQFVVEVI